MFRNDFVDIVLVDVGVPDVVRIDDHHRAFGTTVHATRQINAHPAFAAQVQLLDAILGVAANTLRVMLVAALASVVALIDTEKYVMLVITHGKFS